MSSLLQLTKHGQRLSMARFIPCTVTEIKYQRNSNPVNATLYIAVGVGQAVLHYSLSLNNPLSHLIPGQVLFMKLMNIWTEVIFFQRMVRW